MNRAEQPGSAGHATLPFYPFSDGVREARRRHSRRSGPRSRTAGRDRGRSGDRLQDGRSAGVAGTCWSWSLHYWTERSQERAAENGTPRGRCELDLRSSVTTRGGSAVSASSRAGRTVSSGEHCWRTSASHLTIPVTPDNLRRLRKRVERSDPTASALYFGRLNSLKRGHIRPSGQWCALDHSAGTGVASGLSGLTAGGPEPLEIEDAGSAGGRSMPVKLGELLLKENMVSPQQLQDALNHQRQNGGKLGKAFVVLGFRQRRGDHEPARRGSTAYPRSTSSTSTSTPPSSRSSPRRPRGSTRSCRSRAPGALSRSPWPTRRTCSPWTTSSS